ncbi:MULTISPECIES: DUF5703 family protein [unclassified Gordonia (in: high G+C Gram-positive bacteria)]|uniref:DUF5703 family protein n=1 Tax=unclassified Gordonia (in: high G+C Gram-positive bacteria) TaxID=2657482 RepID=UPI001F10279A|nr:DUF5703 family protein [Gordonia sp. ABSL49_1]MCH5642822.1 DUF5703 family protein [Gordonia sp. ABSL49_1]
MSAKGHRHLTPQGRVGARLGARYPAGWEVTSEDYECLLLRLPPEVTRVTASMRLALEAEFGGWELSRVRLYSDGTRKVLLRRKRPPRRPGPGHPDRNHPGQDATAC